MAAFAHSKEGCPPEQWHPLESHLRDVAALASRFASKWDCARWGHYAGLWHDVGKFRAEFQEMLSRAPADAEADTVRTHVNHSSAGALLARREVGDEGLPLAFVIAGHHAGLADLEGLKRRIDDSETGHLQAAEANGAKADWLSYERDLCIPAFAQSPPALEFWIRMLFSALIDADRLDTERFHDAARPAERSFAISLEMLRKRLDAKLAAMSRSALDTVVNRARARVLADCRRRASEPQGVFTLTVPTGGGKTLASMAFALDHALRHSLDRVIVVIPYTSIIEQNARVFRSVFGDDAIVEHHSAFDPPVEPSRLWLAAENWDAPVVVTTTVQFFESLFANRTSAARKLHNIARSVIVFDEVQTLPSGLLAPIVDGLRELADHYRSTIVLSTATQPALRQRKTFAVGFTETREIVAAPDEHFRVLDRVEVHWPADARQPLSYAEVATRVEPHERALVVVHLRNDARELALLIPDAYHLSASMCPEHRTNVLDVIRGRLKAGARCRVISTQLVEAGVDLDFPVVFRALGGLDSIAQAAGRCNREGTLKDAGGNLRRGVVEVFVAPTSPPRGLPTAALEVTRTMLAENGGAVDINDPRMFERYFRALYASRTLDAKGIQADRDGYRYATVAEKFKMIESGWQSPLLIPYDTDAIRLIEGVRRAAGAGSVREIARRLQRYSINVPKKRVTEMLDLGLAEDLTGTGAFIALRQEEMDRTYDARFGLDLSRRFTIEPEDLIA